MQKCAFQGNGRYRTVFEPLPTTKDTLIYRDRASTFLPYAEDFPKLHFHDRYEIGICNSGKGLFLSEGEFFSITEGDAVLLPPGKRHYSRSIDPDVPCRVRFAYILPSAIRTTLESLHGTDTAQILSNAAEIPTVLRGEETEQIRIALNASGTHADAVTVLALCILLLKQTPTVRRSEEGGMQKPSEEASELAEYLSLHYSENESIQTLSAQYHLSASQLRRKFVAAYGMPPVAYRNAQRCKIGAELLLRTSIPISAISERLGFTTPTEFYRVFRKHYGCSPSEFRKKSI